MRSVNKGLPKLHQGDAFTRYHKPREAGGDLATTPLQNHMEGFQALRIGFVVLFTSAPDETPRPRT
eukprot:1583050-Amphidinium_carterae.1